MSKSKLDWHLQTKLEKCLLSSLIIVSVLLIGISIFVIVKLTLMENKSCNSPVCISAANHILNNIDQAVNPCDDFFKFSCGNLIKTHGSGYHESKQLKERIKGQLEKLMKEPIQENDHYLVKNQKILFQSCMNKNDDKEENLNYFKSIVKELNGWPLLDGDTWNYTDWLEVVYRLKNYGLHYSFFLDVKVDSDPLNITKNIVHISDQFMLTIKDKHKDIYLKYLRDSITFLGGNSTNVEKEILEIYELNKALLNISQKNEYQFDNITKEIILRRFKVEDFQKRNNKLNWLNLINNFLSPVSRITEDDYVIFPIQEYVDAFFDIMESTPNRVKVNTLIWGVFDSFTHYFPKDIESLDKMYRCAKYEYINQEKITEICRNTVARSFELIPTDMVYAQQVLSVDSKNEVKELVRYVKSEFETVLSKAPWMDQKSIENAIKKLHAVVEVVGNEDYFQDPVLKMFENRTLSENDTLMVLFIKSRKLYVDMQNALLLFPGNYNKYRIINKNANTINAYYMADRNVIALFTGILQNNLVSKEHNKYLNYGNLGTILGHELTHAFCKFASEYDETGNRGVMWTDYTSEEFDKATQCVLDEADNFKIKGSEKKMNSSYTLEENIADLTGVKVAYLAYKKWVEENGAEMPLVGLNYTPYQLFWVSAVLDYCYDMDESAIERVIEYDPHAINTFRVNTPLKNNNDFAKDFNCPEGSPMNPSRKCVVF